MFWYNESKSLAGFHGLLKTMHKSINNDHSYIICICVFVSSALFPDKNSS